MGPQGADGEGHPKTLLDTRCLMGASLPSLLLIEDDPDDIARVVRAFKKSELKNPLVCARNFAEAKAFLGAEPPHSERTLPALILLDLRLPGHSGLEVLAWIRAQEKLGYLPVVVYSGSEDPSLIRRSYELGANSFISKDGVQDGTLSERVKGLLSYWLKSNLPPIPDKPS